MKILFIASNHLSLYKEIEREILRQGNEVKTIIDKFNRYDPGVEKKDIRYYIKVFLWKTSQTHYWHRQISRNPVLSENFDCLLVLSGVSLTKYLVDYLNKKNPGMKKILYTWDSCNFYPFQRLLPFFEKSYSFDIQDVNNDSRWRLLPIFYLSASTSQTIKSEFDLFLVGTNHGGRYSFVKKILPQLKHNKIRYYIRIVTKPILNSKKRIIFNLIFGNQNNSYESKEAYYFSHGMENSEFISREPIPYDEYIYYISRANCVLDDQRDGQTGLSARFIWALANNKKIVTTNKNALDYPFVNKNQVFIIDKKHPIIPVQFIKSPLKNKEITNISFLRIDNWVRQLLS